MAKRRRLEAPSSVDLDRFEREFRDETGPGLKPGHGLAPIAQVAAETAREAQPTDAALRAARAKAEADAAKYEAAQQQGLLMAELPIDEIDENVMVRDRLAVDESDMSELRQSIAANGLRLPIEVFELEQPGSAGQRYGLISGYRRLLATRELFAIGESDKYRFIRAIVRKRKGAADAFAAMVEENEIRAELSHFERGRIAVIAANQGAFADTDDAVKALFGAGSKAKRSKIRSFALIFEELGDLLKFPDGLTEKRGLKVATALRHGGGTALRMALEARAPMDADDEWSIIEAAILSVDHGNDTGPNRGGRPRAEAKKSDWLEDRTIRTANGITIRVKPDGKGHLLRLEGDIDTGRISQLMTQIKKLLEK